MKSNLSKTLMLLGLGLVSISQLAVVAHAEDTATNVATTNIDPSDERPLPTRSPLPGKLKMNILASEANEIDPEREAPILGKGKGILKSEQTQQEPKEVKENQAGSKGKATPQGPGYTYDNPRPTSPTDSPFGLDVRSITATDLQDWANALTVDPDLQIYAVRMSVAAVAASIAIMTYRMAAIGGRQRALAALIPPEFLMDQLGRKGIRVPSNANYSPEDAVALAQTLVKMNATEVNAYVQTLDPELVNYFAVVVYYVRSAKAQEFLAQCPNPDLCA